MSALPGAQIREWIELLERAGYLETDPVHGGIDTTERAAAVLFSDEQVLARVQHTTLAGRERRKKQRVPDGRAASGRAEGASLPHRAGAGRPGLYRVFQRNASGYGREAAGSMQELLEVSGVGHVKAERYGAAFLNEIRQFEHTNREES